MIKKIIYTAILLCCTQFAFAQRDTLSNNEKWTFLIDEKGEGISQNWASKTLTGDIVNAPHTWQVDNKNQMYYGWAWYQKQVEIPANWKNKHVVLQFEAINHTAKIFINGKELFEHHGDGFSKFKIAMDDYLQYGKKNTLSVAVNNAYSKDKVPYSNSFDWANDGGLIRPVSWIVSEKNSADEIRLHPQFNTKDSTASLKIELWAAKASSLQNTTWQIKIEEDNQATHQTIVNKKIKPQANGKSWVVEIPLGKVKPWHFDAPNLYRVNVALQKGNKTIDQISDVTGFREMVFRDGKFYLNGEKIKLMGVEWTAGSNPEYGFAEPETFIRKMGDRMKEVNCIFTRQHFQQSDVFYDFCDRKGIIVQQEIPLWGGETPSSKTIKDIAMQQITAMVQNFYNHPSIFSWGVGNELNGRDLEMKNMIQEMIDSVRKLDPSRHVAYVSNTLTKGFINYPNFVPDAAAAGDYLMMNEYGGSWWDLPIGDIGKYLDSVHMSYPNKPFLISEFGLCGPNFRGGDQRRLEDLIYHMALYESKPYVEGAIYFDLTDYRTHYPGTTETNKFRRRVHGIYDMYGNPKPSMRVLREQSSPIEVHSVRNGEKGKASVLIFGATGLPEHTVKGYKLYITDSVGMKNFQQSKAYTIPDLKPGQRMEIPVENPYKDGAIVTIVRPTGYVVSQKSFFRVLPEEKNFE